MFKFDFKNYSQNKFFFKNLIFSNLGNFFKFFKIKFGHCLVILLLEIQSLITIN